MKIFVTGCAGFIGMHFALASLREGNSIVGIDNINSYYDPNLKHARLNLLKENSSFEFFNIDLADKPALQDCIAYTRPDVILHLAAQAGVRY